MQERIRKQMRAASNLMDPVRSAQAGAASWRVALTEPTCTPSNGDFG